jgi:hypothetical protein
MTEPEKRTQVILDVATPSQAAELNAAWQEIIAGKRTRLNTAAEDTNEIRERARVGLSRIVKAVEQNPGTVLGAAGSKARALSAPHRVDRRVVPKRRANLEARAPR